MNKNELITFLRNPNDLTESDLGELEKVVENNPYFLNGRLLLAKASKELKHPDTRKRISSAAVYSTDRPLFKKYLSDKLFFLSKPPEEEEELAQEVDKPKEKVASKPAASSQKIEIIDLPKEVAKKEVTKAEEPKEEKPKEPAAEEKPRREPRFDPSATASFKRRWDTKSESDSPPVNKEPEKTTEKPLFVGKKIDRNRVKKKSIREELLNDGTSKKKAPKQEDPKPSVEDQKSKEDKAPLAASKPEEAEKNESSKSAPEVKKEAITPDRKEKPADLEQKEKPKAIKIQARPKATEAQEKPKAQERPESFFDDIKKVVPQKKQPLNIKSKASEKPQPPKKLAQEEEHTPVVVRTSKPGLKIPEVPSGGIDALLEELQRDMENLKSSRTKFAEVQQKIEEDDAVSAAVERATNKIPEPKPQPPVETTVKEDTSQKEEQKAEDPPIKKEKTKKAASTKVKTTAKKATSPKKKTPPKKEASSKKATSKKTTTTKTTAKPKSAKTKSTKKDEKKDDDKSGKQKVDQSHIIDKFIAETPSIKYQKKSEPVQNQDLSGESTVWNKELASEYLAEIYLHQGNKKRAIEIYTSLSLKFPEKKSYFADLISKTK